MTLKVPAKDDNYDANRKAGRAKVGRKGLSQIQQERLLALFLGRWEPINNAPPHGLTYKQIAEHMGLNSSTVIRYCKIFSDSDPELAKRLRYRPQPFTPEAIRIVQNIASSENPPEGFKPTRNLALLPEQDALKHLKDGSLGVMTPDEMMAALSRLASTAPPQYRVAAIQALDRLMATYKPAETFGPPTPISEPDRIARLSRVLECVGQPTTAATLESLWPGTFSFAGSTQTSTSIPSSTQISLELPTPSSSKPEDGSAPTNPTPSASGWTDPQTASSEPSTPSRAPSS